MSARVFQITIALIIGILFGMFVLSSADLGTTSFGVVLGVVGSLIAALIINAAQKGSWVYAAVANRHHRRFLGRGMLSGASLTVMHSCKVDDERHYVHLGDAHAAVTLTTVLTAVTESHVRVVPGSPGSSIPTGGALMLIGGPSYNVGTASYCSGAGDPTRPGFGCWVLGTLQVNRPTPSVRTLDGHGIDGVGPLSADWDGARQDYAVVAAADDRNGRRVIVVFGLTQYGTMAAAQWIADGGHGFTKFCKAAVQGRYWVLSVKGDHTQDPRRWSIMPMGQPRPIVLAS